MKNHYLKYVLAALKDVIKSIVLKGIAEIIIMNFVEENKKENLGMKTMVNNVNASRNILKEGLKIYRQGLSITKAERKSDFGNKAHSMKPEAHPIALAWVGSSLLQYPFLRKWMRKTIIPLEVKDELYLYFNSHLDNISPDYKYLIDIPKLKFKKGR